MSTKKEQKPSLDITQTGALTWKDLQEANYSLDQIMSYGELQDYFNNNNTGSVDTALELVKAKNSQWYGFDEQSPIYRQSKGTDYLGNSHWDPDFIDDAQWEAMQGNPNELRAENQPWYSKLVNGIGKAGVLAVTTAAETIGLLYGAGHSLLETLGVIEDDNKSWLQDLWDNPITNALQNINETAEKWMPNYYTQDEIENPFSNIFTANFLGDKILKNLGFMVGAFYGGIPASTVIGKAGTSYVKAARAAATAERFGAAKAGLTAVEQGKIMAQGLDKVRRAAQTTRAVSQTIGALGSAINEGAIEAINNSKDWANHQIEIAEDEYQNELRSIEEVYGNTEMYEALKIAAREKYNKKLEEIELGRARMGNADLLLNLPILMMSNMYQLGRLYSRGFDSTRRQLGNFWNGHKLKGSLKEGTLASDKTWKKGITSAILKSNTEGLEEYLQRAASDGAGEAVSASIDRFMKAGTGEHAKEDVDEYIAGFGKAVADNIGDPNAWEEYMIGAVSSMFGMPVFGSQTKNAYIGKNSRIGLAGGLYGNYKDYMATKEHEEQVARYLNQRVKDPKFKALYDNLKKQDDYDKWLQDELEKGDKSKYKDLELEKFYSDLNAVASSGHLEEFKQLVGYNTEYSDEELEDIVKQTTRRITPEQQRKQDEQKRQRLLEAIVEAQENNEDALVLDYKKDLEEVSRRLQEDKEGIQPYEEKLEGPFIDRNGQMNATDPDKMREILNRNRENLLEGINEYLKIRNDIDIETDGRLDDTQIALLTQMKGKILDYEKRSAEMANDLIGNLGDVKENQEVWRERIKKEQEEAQEEYNNAKQHWEAVKDSKSSKEHKENVEKAFLAAEKKLNKAKAASRAIDNALKLLEMLTEEKDTTASERAAEARGEGQGFFGRLDARFQRGQKRAVNSDEAQAILANPDNVRTLIRTIISKTSDLDAPTRQRLEQEAADLSVLANKKIAYNKQVREYLGENGSEKINEAFKQREDQISQKEKDNKSEELALSIRNARSMSELDRLMKDALNINREIAKAAMQKAKQTSDDSTKKFLEDYEKATRFSDSFVQQALKLDEAVRAGVMETAGSAWEEALTNGVDVYDKFVQNLNDAAVDLEADSNPMAKQTATGLKQVLKDLEAGASSVKTNKKTKQTTASSKKVGINPDDTSDEDDAAGLGALAALRKKGSKAEPKTDTTDDLNKDVEQEIRNSKQKDGSYVITDISKLSKNLQDRIQKYNDEHPNAIYTPDIEAMLDRIADEDIEKDDTNLDENDLKDDGTDLGEENDGSDRAERMHENLRVSFKSDHPTEFRFNVDYRIPYDPEDKVLQAVQKLMKELKAYQFVDKNYLGYLAREMEGHPTIHFLRSTDETICSDPANPITFLAVKWDNKAEQAVRKHGFNGSKEANLSEEIKPVIINGEQYQIVGVMTLNSEVDQKVSEAFASLQGALNQELNPQIEEARQNGLRFVVSKLSTQVDSINTGRLEKRNDEKDSEEKVSLYEFMTSQQGNPERRISTEWESGSDFYFGVIVNGMLNATEDEDIRALFEEPNDTWMEKNNGSIVMFVPKPDGRLYPARCTRRTVKEWMDANADGRTGLDLMSAIIHGNAKNGYLNNILGYLRNIYNSEATVGDRMKAKVMLSKYFIFGKQSPIHFDGDEVSLTFEDREYDLTSDDFEEFVSKFFDILSQENIMFTIPTHSIEKIKGRDIISSGILEIGLRNFYNFNANFTIFPIDKDGNPIVIESNPEEGSHFTGGNNIRANAVEFDLGDGMKTYIIEGDGTVTLNGKSVDADIQNIITAARKAENGEYPSYMEFFLQQFYNNPEIIKFVSEGLHGFDGIYVINDNPADPWIYDGRKGDHNIRLYRLNEPNSLDGKQSRGNKLKESIKKAKEKFVKKEENWMAINKLKKASKTVPEVPKAPETPTQPISPTAPVVPSAPNKGAIQPKQFAGKTLDNLNDRGTELEKWLINNRTSPIVKGKHNGNAKDFTGIFEVLQGAEEAGQPINQNEVLKILQSDMTPKEKLAKAIDEINGCHK